MSSSTTQINYSTYRYGIYNELAKVYTIDQTTTYARTEYKTLLDKSARIPNYRKLISQGECATSLLHIEEESCKVERTDVDVYVENLAGTEKLRYFCHGYFQDEGKPPGGIPALSSSVENQALSNFYSNLAAVESRFKGLVFAGELKETLSMIRHPARALRRGVSEYLSLLKKRGPKLRFRDRPRFVRDTWLEWSFGVRPLISDLDSAIKAFYLSDAARPIFEMVRGTNRSQEILSSSPVNYGPAHNSRTQGLRVVTDEVIVKFYGTYKSSGSGVIDCHHYGFSPWEFVPTIWELIPYSFLVDYFTNVGKILESWSYRNLGPRFVSKTTIQERRLELKDMRLVPSPQQDGYKITTIGSPGTFSSRNRTIFRTPDVGTIIPSLELKVPGNWSQWVNIAALSKQLEGTRRSLRR